MTKKYQAKQKIMKGHMEDEHGVSGFKDTISAVETSNR